MFFVIFIVTAPLSVLNKCFLPFRTFTAQYCLSTIIPILLTLSKQELDGILTFAMFYSSTFLQLADFLEGILRHQERTSPHCFGVSWLTRKIFSHEVNHGLNKLENLCSSASHKTYPRWDFNDDHHKSDQTNYCIDINLKAKILLPQSSYGNTWPPWLSIFVILSWTADPRWLSFGADVTISPSTSV